MNVTINETGPCKRLLRLEAAETEVAQALADVEKDFVKHAQLPGFRKGKAPVAMVLKGFEKDITEEAKKKLLSSTYQAAIKEKNLNVFNLLGVEEVVFQRGQPLQFVANIEILPEFELPAYRGLPARREERSVAEADVDHAIGLLRNRRATFLKVDREARPGDIAVVNYTGTCDGQPVSTLSPDAQGLGEQKEYWVELKEGTFIPGFAKQLEGATAGGKRTVEVQFPADFPTQPLAGKKVVYDVEVTEIKERLLPPFDDAFAKTWEATDVASLREGVRQDLQSELNDKQNRSVREQVIHALLAPLNFDLPESAVLAETRNIIYELVHENQKRGVTKEAIDKNKDEISRIATGAARERVKALFVFQKIAEREGIKVEPTEFHAHIFAMAKSMQTSVEQVVKELKKRDGLGHIHEQLLTNKVIDFLQSHAKIQDVPPSPTPV